MGEVLTISASLLERLDAQNRTTAPAAPSAPEPAPASEGEPTAPPAVLDLRPIADLPPPEQLPDEESRRVWREVVQELATVGWVRRVDVPAAVGMCQAVALRDHVYRQLHSGRASLATAIAYTVETRNGKQRKRAPLFQAWRELQADALRALEAMGCTPRARQTMTGGLQSSLFAGLDDEAASADRGDDRE